MDQVENSPNAEPKTIRLPETPKVNASKPDYGSSTSNAWERVRTQRSGTKDEMFFASYMEGRKYQLHGEFEKALHQYKVALQSKFKTIESEPTDIQEDFCNILFEIGEIHCNSGHEDSSSKGMEAFYFCLDRRRTCLGSNHRGVAVVLTKLASIHARFSEHDRALDLLLEALSIYLSVSSMPEIDYDTTSDLISVWNAIGLTQQALGCEDDALSSFDEALKLS